MHNIGKILPGDQVTRDLAAVKVNFFTVGAPGSSSYIELIPARRVRLTALGLKSSGK